MNMTSSNMSLTSNDVVYLTDMIQQLSKISAIIGEAVSCSTDLLLAVFPDFCTCKLCKSHSYCMYVCTVGIAGSVQYYVYTKHSQCHTVHTVLFMYKLFAQYIYSILIVRVNTCLLTLYRRGWPLCTRWTPYSLLMR